MDSLSLDESKTVTLVSKDGQSFEIDTEMTKISDFIVGVCASDSMAETITTTIEGQYLAKVVEYLKFHYENPAKEIPVPLPSNKLEDVACEWDVEFVNLENSVLFDLTSAANFMGVMPLVHLCCAKVATLMKGKTPAEIRETFGIEDDLTPEEVEEIKNEVHWADNAALAEEAAEAAAAVASIEIVE